MHRFGFTTAAMLAAVGLLLGGGGYGLGRWDGARRSGVVVDAVAGATFLARVAALNDPRAMAEKCRLTRRREKGGVACDLPPVWVAR